MSAKTIYDRLRSHGMSHNGACAMIGNMQAESSLISNIAQRGMTSLTDEQYTMTFNATPEKCYNDGVGYGLCQWTYPTRKRNLRQFARNWNVSVGAEDMQVAFAVEELKTEYAALWKFLCGDCDLYIATKRICYEFENPAIKNVDARYKCAQNCADFIDSMKILASTHPENPATPDQSVLVLQAVLLANGYSTQVDGHKSEEFFDLMRELLNSMATD